MIIAEMAARAAGEVGQAAAAVEESALDALAEEIATARRVVAYGVGREGLMMRALAMRHYHLGLDAHVVGDMGCPPVGAGDLLLVSAGPGGFSTVDGLLGVARRAGARTACVTAQPQGSAPGMADRILVIPAQTMANDRGAGVTSVLPMGSLFEGAQFLVFEFLVLRLRDRLSESAESMRARHTNLE